MYEITKPLAALSNYANFILYEAVWNDKKQKFDKLPTSPITGRRVGNNDLTHHVTYERAVEAAIKYKMGLGFVFNDQTPFWFLDIDNCINDGQYTPLAQKLCEGLPGAAIEISQSGKGLHVFGTGNVPAHSCRNIALDLEFYTEGRFCALTQTGVVGDASVDLTEHITKVVHDYFPPKAKKDKINWTSAPNPNWRGPTDDNELIKKMLKAKSTHAAFGNGCSFRDLWEGNENPIASVYPAVGSDECVYNPSSADAALCLQLAWWTGGDCERIERLFNQSALVRDKWNEREKYRHDTITNAVGICVGCYGEDIAKKEQARIAWKPEEPSKEMLNRINLLSGPRIVAFEQRKDFFHNHFYLRGLNKVFCPDGYMRGMNEYNACYGNYEFLEQYASTKPIRDPWKAYVTATDVERIDADDVIYSPGNDFLDFVNRNNKHYVNTCVNTDVKRIPGDISLFLNHIELILPDKHDRDVLLSYMASFLQNPGVKFRWALFLQGAEGCGKSLIGRILAGIIGDSHVYYINPEEFCKGATFNKWAGENRLGMIEEMSVGDRKEADPTLKRYIDHHRIEVQSKGVDQSTRDICINFIINSNNKGSLPINDSSRRYAPLFCKQQTAQDIINSGMDGKYFAKIFKWLENGGYEAIFDYLLSYQIPEELDPALGAQRAPITSSFQEAVRESMPVVEVAIRDLLKSGEPGTREGWVSVNALTKLLAEDNIRLRSSQSITRILTKLGYVIHPALASNNGRTNQEIVHEGGVRVKLFLEPNNKALKELSTGRQVIDAYRVSQNYITPPVGVLP